MGNIGVALAVVLVVMWTLQMALSILQVKRYFKRVNVLRRFGRVASGMAGGRYKGRTYGILAVDTATRRITRAEQLAGVTVFASPKSVPQLVGVSLDALLDDASTVAELSPRSADAFRAAASTLRDSFLKTDEQAEAQTQREHEALPQEQLSPSVGSFTEVASIPSATPVGVRPAHARAATAQRRPQAHTQRRATRPALRPALRFVKE